MEPGAVALCSDDAYPLSEKRADQDKSAEVAIQTGRPPATPRRCDYCGSLLFPKTQWAGQGQRRLESSWGFQRRRYCGLSCANRGRARRRAVDPPAPGQPIPPPPPASCRHCGGGKPYLVLDSSGPFPVWGCRRCGWDCYAPDQEPAATREGRCS